MMNFNKIIDSHLYLVVLLCFLITSCKKETIDLNDPDFVVHATVPEDSIYMTGSCLKEVPNKGTVKWKFNTFLYKMENGKYHLGFFTVSAKYLTDFQQIVLREGISLSNFPLEIGEYGPKIINLFDPEQDSTNIISSFRRYFEDGDVYDGACGFDKSKDASFKIVKIDKERRIIEGTFNLRFKQYDFNNPNEFSKNINFLDGKFKARIPD